MKISKRILGVALVVIMVLNVFAVGAFAAFPTDTAVKLALKADKTSYAKGDTITLTFSEQVIPEIGLMRIGGQYDMGYNSSVFELISDATAETGALDKHGFKALQNGYDTGISGVQIPSSSGVSPLYDWDTAVTWNVGDDTTTTFAATEMTDLFTVQIKVKDDAPEGTYTIGFNPAGYEGYSAYSNDGAGNGGLYGVSGTDYGFSVPNMYEFGTCTITVGNGGPTNKPVVSNLETQVRWQDKNAGLLDIGFCGSVSGLTPELDTDGVTVKNVERIGFKFSRTDATLTNNVTTVDAYTLYDFTAETAGTYKFRAVVTGDDLDYKKTDALYACAFIQIGSEEILATNAKIDTTINAEYLDAVNNHNMPAFGA